MCKNSFRLQLMSLVSASVGFEDYKFKKRRKSGVVESERSEVSRPL